MKLKNNVKKEFLDIVSVYNNYYKKNNFNLQPTIWNVNSSYIKKAINEKNFRNDNAFVWQIQLGDKEKNYVNYYKKLKAKDSLGLFEKTFEDDSFGCINFKAGDVNISRDLLDSINEIYFLKNNFENLETMNILDIGAGYGRLCKRYMDCFPGTKYYITDGIPHSTYLANIYLTKYGYQEFNIKINEFEKLLKGNNIDIAINIHSFPEMNITDIEYWISILHKYQVRYIFFVPNNPLSNKINIPTNDGKNMLPIFNKYNYEINKCEDTFKLLEIKYSYSVPYFIFELRK